MSKSSEANFELLLTGAADLMNQLLPVCDLYHPAIATVALPALLGTIIKEAPKDMQQKLLDESATIMRRAFEQEFPA